MEVNEIIVGTPVTYWAVIKGNGQRFDPTNTVITSEAYEVGGQLCCKVSGISGAVSIKHLVKAFLVDDQWKLFLEKVKLDEALMHPDQVREMKRAFYAGCGQMLLVIRDEVSKLKTDDDMIAAMDNLLSQINKFWSEQ